jgi:hypothetical protein
MEALKCKEILRPFFIRHRVREKLLSSEMLDKVRLNKNSRIKTCLSDIIVIAEQQVGAYNNFDKNGMQYLSVHFIDETWI